MGVGRHRGEGTGKEEERRSGRQGEKRVGDPVGVTLKPQKEKSVEFLAVSETPNNK